MSEDREELAGASHQEPPKPEEDQVGSEEWPRRTSPATLRFMQVIIRADASRLCSGEPRRFLG